MLKALKQRRENDEQGFTLIELMVVVLIIAILLAIAIPTFLGAQNRAKDRAAQSDLRNGLTAAKTLATDQEGYFRKADTATPLILNDYVGIDAVLDLKPAEESLTWVVGAGAATIDAVGVTVNTSASGTAASIGQEILLVKVSKAKGNTAYGIYAHQNGTVGFCKADAPVSSNANAATLVGAIAWAPAANCAGKSFADATDLG